MAELTVYSTSDDGDLVKTAITYLGARQSSIAYTYTNTRDYFVVGQNFASSQYSIWRGALYFDTSGLPDNAEISAAILSLYCESDHSTQDFTLEVVTGMQSATLEVADYGRLFGAIVSYGSLATSGISVGAYNAITLNATGRAEISLSGITKFGLKSSRDIAGNEPTGEEWLQLYTYEKGGTYRPKLVITYTLTGPSVSTDAATSISNTGATLNGTLVDDDGAAKDCGFEWGRTTNYGNTTATESKETAETFSQALTGLLPETIYHFRALADGVVGVDRLFMALTAAPSVFSGLVGTLRHHAKRGRGGAARYRLEIGLGGYGRAFSTLPFAHYEAAYPVSQPDFSPAPTPAPTPAPSPAPVPGVPQTDICAMRDQAWSNYLRAMSEGRYAEAPALQRIWQHLNMACTSGGTIYAPTGVRFSASTEELHRARRPLKDWWPGQVDQAIQRLARSPIHQAAVSDVAFTAVDHNSISWAAGDIVFSNGVSYPIAAGSLDLTATHYIYYIRGDNALWSSTTFSDAIAYNKTLIATATAVASGGKAKIFVLFSGPAGGLDPSNYLLLTGGKLTGDLEIEKASPNFDIDATSGNPAFRFYAGGVIKGYFLYDTADDAWKFYDEGLNLLLTLDRDTGNITPVSGATIDGIDISAHDPATTGVHGVGANTLEHTGNKGAASGYLGLDASGYIPAVTLGGTVTVSAQDLDASAASLNVKTTGAGQGIIITSTQDAATGAQIVLKQVKTTQANADVLGEIQWHGKDDLGGSINWGGYHLRIDDITNTSKDSRVQWWLWGANSWKLAAYILGTGTVAGDLAYAEFDEFEGEPLDDVKLMVKDALPQLERIGVVAKKEGGHMLNFQPAIYLAWGGIRQNRTLIEQVKAELQAEIGETRRLLEAKS